MDTNTKVKKGLASVLVSSLLIVTGTTFAIDKEKHSIVTEKAIKTFNECLRYIDKEKYQLSMVKGGVISLYAKLEDETPVLDRASNWHFHDQFHGTEHSLKFPYYIIRPSLHEIFNDRVQALSYVDKPSPDIEIDDDVYLNETKEQISGRIIHYIQDMGVPAHVSPIYHSKPEGWFQELFVPNDPDSFDSLFTEANIGSLGSLNMDKKSCEILYERSQKKSMSLVNVLDGFAAATRKKVKTKINGKIPSAWNNKSWEDIFWPIRTRDNNYENDKFAHAKKGKYGFLKRHNNIFSLPSAGCKNQENVYCEFFKEQYLAVRDNSILALMMIYLK